MKRKRYMVFMHVNDNGTECWTAYTRNASPYWSGFVGYFDVECKNWKDGERKAIAYAKDGMGKGSDFQAGKELAP